MTVLPTQIDALKIEQGQDLMTLVTCTPYSVNTHRLLVRGHRIPYEEKIEEQAMAQKARMPLHLKILLIGLICLGLIWGTMKLISLRTQPKKQKRRKRMRKGADIRFRVLVCIAVWSVWGYSEQEQFMRRKQDG